MDEKPKIEILDMQDTKVDVQAMVDETVRRVREQSDKLQTVAQPYANKTRDFAETRPVLFTFIAIFTALSFIPVALFIGFLFSALLFIVGFAAAGICISCLGVIVLGVSILLPILFFTAFLSTLAVSSLLSAFLAHRLYLHLRAATTSPTTGETVFDYETIGTGASAWFEETKTRAGFPKPSAASAPAQPMPIIDAGGKSSDVKWVNGGWSGPK